MAMQASIPPKIRSQVSHVHQFVPLKQTFGHDYGAGLAHRVLREDLTPTGGKRIVRTILIQRARQFLNYIPTSSYVVISAASMM